MNNMYTTTMSCSYSFPTKPRYLDFNAPYDNLVSGKCKDYQTHRPASTKQRIPISNTQESRPRIKLIEQPNSKRTLAPELNKDKSNKRSSSHTLSYRYNKSSGLLSPQTKNPLMNYDLPRRIERKNNSNTFKSFKFGENYGEPLNSKKMNKTTIYDIYGTTSQIFNLPGCIKRPYIERVKKNKCNEDSLNLKYNNDFSSNVYCLPGAMTKENGPSYYDTYHIKVDKVNNVSRETKEPNFFRQGKKFFSLRGNKNEGKLNIFRDGNGKVNSNKEYEYKMQGRKKMPEGMPDQFRSQFIIC